MTSTRWISGSLTFCGRLERTRVTASLTSLSARSVLVSSANWIVVTDRPSVIDDEICRTPSTRDTPPSMVLVPWLSRAAGAAPNCATATEITGMSALGSRVTASLVKLTQPSTSRMIEKTIEGGGCRIDHAGVFKAIRVPAGAAGSGSTMPRYSKPLASPRALEFVGEHDLDLVAVMQRGASIGHDGFADIEAFKNFGRGFGGQADAHPSRLDGVAFHDLQRQAVDGGARDGDAARALGVDIGAGKHADLERRIVVQRNPHLAKLRGAVDLRRDLPDLADNIGRVVTADAHRRTRIELQQMHARHFGFELDFIVHGNPEHRACLRRGGGADRGPDLGDEAAGGSAQRDRPGPAGGGARYLRRRSEAREFLIFGDRVAFLDEQVGDAGALLIDADLRFAARHDEAGDAHHVGEAGIGGLGHDHQRLARRVFLFRT